MNSYKYTLNFQWLITVKRDGIEVFSMVFCPFRVMTFKCMSRHWHLMTVEFQVSWDARKYMWPPRFATYSVYNLTLTYGFLTYQIYNPGHFNEILSNGVFLVGVLPRAFELSTTHTWRTTPFQWCYNECEGDWYHQRLLRRLFRRTSKKTSKPELLALCEGNPPVTCGFPTQRASNAETFYIWWHQHYDNCYAIEGCYE